MAASVVRNECIVAMLGWIMPAPLATPPSRTVPVGQWHFHGHGLGVGVGGHHGPGDIDPID